MGGKWFSEAIHHRLRRIVRLLTIAGPAPFIKDNRAAKASFSLLIFGPLFAGNCLRQALLTRRRQIGPSRR